MLKNGQMCVTVDTTYVPKADLDEFVKLVKARYVAAGLENYAASTECCGIITECVFNVHSFPIAN